MKVSIIVPVYNAEKYLDKCVESITKQTEEDIEILLIDDDSTDSSGRMCEEWAKKDSRIRVFHIENIGVSNARNQGIKNSNSPYIMFVDSDDWIKKDMVGCLLKNIEESKSQAVFCNYIIVRDGEEIPCEGILEYKVYQSDEVSKIISNMFGGGRYYSSIWRGIYKREIIENSNIYFQNLQFAEDLVFNLEYLLNCNRVKIIKDELYYYRVNSTSALQSLKNKVDEIQKVPYEIYSLITKYNCLEKYSVEMLSELSLTAKRLFDINNKYSNFKVNAANFRKWNFKEIEKYSNNDRISKMYFQRKWIKLYVYLWIEKIKNHIHRE